MFSSHWTAVLVAAHNRHLDVVEFLFDSKADITVTANNRWTAVNAAAQHGHLDGVKFFLEHSDQALTKDNTGRSPLFVAIKAA